MQNQSSPSKKRSARRTILAVGTLIGVLAVGGGVAMASGGGGGGSPPPEPPVDKEPVPDNEPDPQPDPNPQPQPDPPPDGALKFDLKTNWGGLPMSLRKELARMELAAQIPGLARFLGVKAWQAYRSGQDFVDLATAAKIAADHPELCRRCWTPGDAADSKKLLDANIAQGWPKPKDYDGVAGGSYGLFDLLGATAVYAGIHTEKNKNTLPLLTAPNFREMMERYDAQGFAASYVVRRLMVSTKYKVLVPGANAANGDSLNTWGNIGAAYAMPDQFAQNTQKAKDAKTRFLARAVEIGIDLGKNAYPWPQGKVYKAPTWTAGQVWERLQDYKLRDVVDIGGGGVDIDLPNPANVIPDGPITKAERDAVEVVLAMNPQPDSYKDGQGRVWTPCVPWWLGKDIPDWPPGVWPGQVPYLYHPPDTADWLGCIAGYLVYKGPLADAATKTFPDEALTVDITKRLAARRIILRTFATERLTALGRANQPILCNGLPPAPPPVQEPPNPDPDPDLDQLIDLAQGIRVRVLSKVAPDAEAPMVVLLHGRDATEQQLLSTIPAGVPARFALLRAPDAQGFNFRWYTGGNVTPDAELVPQIETAVGKVVAALKVLLSVYPMTSKLYLVGYSQGGSLVYALAGKPASWWNLQQLSVPVVGALVVAGFLPTPMRPTGATTMPLWAIHGQKDQAVSFQKASDAYNTFIFKTTTKNNWLPEGDHGLGSLRPAAQVFIKEMVQP